MLAHAEADIVDRGLVPVLDVLPVHAAASAMYARRGWRTVTTGRPEWLPDGVADVHYLALLR